MTFAKITDGNVISYPYNPRKDYPKKILADYTSYPDLGVYWVFKTQKGSDAQVEDTPVFNPSTERWEQSWVTPVPSTVTMRQARLVLLKQNLLSQVEGALASLPSPEKEEALIEWEYAAEVRKDSSLVQSLAVGLGLDETALDNLFTLAASL